MEKQLYTLIPLNDLDRVDPLLDTDTDSEEEEKEEPSLDFTDLYPDTDGFDNEPLFP